MRAKFEQYIETIEEHQDMLKMLGEKKTKDNEPENVGEYCQFVGLMLKAEQQEESLKKYHNNIKAISKALSER